MSLLGNIIWIIFGGFFQAVGWFLAGIICFITIIGIPVGYQCFKMAKLQLAPFGKKVVKTKSSAVGLIGNILWIIFLGWELFLANLGAAVFFAVTIIGIPFALQSWKLAKLSLFPFGREVQRK
ncbi:MAG: YccF domain-containing protein [Halanaerobiales bacterium]